MLNQMLPLPLLLLLPLPVVALEPGPGSELQLELARSSLLGLVHRTLTALRLAVGSRVGNVPVPSLHRKEMEGVGLGRRSLMITQRRRCKEEDWEGEVLRTCE